MDWLDGVPPTLSHQLQDAQHLTGVDVSAVVSIKAMGNRLPMEFAVPWFPAVSGTDTR